jgi:hypothetical protein
MEFNKDESVMPRLTIARFDFSDRKPSEAEFEWRANHFVRGCPRYL